MRTRKDPNAKKEKVIVLIFYKLMHSLFSKLSGQTKFFKYKTCQSLRRVLIGVVAKTQALRFFQSAWLTPQTSPSSYFFSFSLNNVLFFSWYELNAGSLARRSSRM
jgi:hypothetical protein